MTNEKPYKANSNKRVKLFLTQMNMFHFICTAEDPRRMCGRSVAPRKIQVEELMVRKTIHFMELQGRLKVFFYLHRGRSAMCGGSAEDMTGGTHAMETSPFQLVEF